MTDVAVADNARAGSPGVKAFNGTGRILIAAGSTARRLELKNAVEALKYEASPVPDAETAGLLLSRGGFDLALLLHDHDSFNALDMLDRLGQECPDLRVIVLTEKASIEDAVRAMRSGAQDFLCAPWPPELLGHAISQAVECGRSIGKNRELSKKGEKGGSEEQDSQASAIGSSERSGQGSETGEAGKAGEAPYIAERHRIYTVSPLMEQLLDKARSVSRSRATVLIQGESGTGKELLARFIHAHSDRAAGPFVALNCAALPETLLESELFGHEKGAFSGAVKKKAGKFELASGGTLLLDEITEMALPLQAKLLRVLQEGEVDRLGGSSPVSVDVRVVATTNRDVLATVRAGKFREDLYFRLNVIPLKLPSLAARKEDIAFLAEHFLAFFSREYGKEGMKFADGVVEYLENRQWQGNIRELRNLVERGILLSMDTEVTLQDILGEDDLPGKIDTSNPQSGVLSGKVFNLDEIEKEMVQRALSKTKGNRTHAAKLLGISVRTLRNKLAEYRRTGLVL